MSVLNKLAKEVHQNAIEHGWWDEERSFGEIISLCHSELSEALEEYRNNRGLGEIYYNGNKPEGIPVELADCIIRILDYCGETDKELLNNVDTSNMLETELLTFGDFITLWHLFLSKSFEEPYKQIYWLSCVIDDIYDWCEGENIDIDEAICIKHEYNKSRPYRHGGKVI